jgi:hypothetical protein
MAAKTKVESEKNVEFAKGGDTPMFGDGDHTKTAAGEAASEQAPGETGHKTSGPNEKYASGGTTKMFGFHPSVPATAGQTGAR